MDEKEKKMIEDNNRMFKKIFKSILYTLITFFLSIYGVYGVISLAFGEMSAEQSNAWGIISLGIGIIFYSFLLYFYYFRRIKKC